MSVTAQNVGQSIDGVDRDVQDKDIQDNHLQNHDIQNNINLLLGYYRNLPKLLEVTRG